MKNPYQKPNSSQIPFFVFLPLFFKVGNKLTKGPVEGNALALTIGEEL